MMAAYRWRERHVLHKLGSIGLVPAMLMFIVGFSVPAWRLGAGLWTRCYSDACISDVSHNSTPLLYTVLTTECVALFLFALSVCVTVYQDFFQHPDSPDNRLVEILATSAGVFSVAGAIFYGVDIGDIRLLDWGYGLIISSAILVFLSAAVIACTRRKQAPETPSNRAPVPMATRSTISEGHPQESLMLVPSSGPGMYPMSSLPRGRPPPPYSLPPPYPYHADCGYLPLQPVAMTTTPQITAAGGSDTFGVPYSEGRLSPVSIDLPCQGHPVTPQMPTFYTTAQADVVPLYVDSLSRQRGAGMPRTSPRLPTFSGRKP